MCKEHNINLGLAVKILDKGKARLFWSYLAIAQTTLNTHILTTESCSSLWFFIAQKIQRVFQFLKINPSEKQQIFLKQTLESSRLRSYRWIQIKKIFEKWQEKKKKYLSNCICTHKQAALWSIPMDVSCTKTQEQSEAPFQKNSIVSHRWLWPQRTCWAPEAASSTPEAFGNEVSTEIQF